MRTLLNSFFWMLLTASLFLSANIFSQNQNSVDDVKRLIARAKTAYSIGEYQDALKEYQKIQQLVPEYPDIYKAIGEVYEKLGGDDDLKAAIENYNQYLRLSPDAQDQEVMTEKIASLEYLYEKQVQQTQILNDFSGIWISEAVTEENVVTPKKSKKDAYREAYEAAKKNESTSKDVSKKMSKASSFVFKITEIGKTGKFRIEILPESGFYKESIIQKTVNVVPDKKNNVTFTFADAQSYMPSQSKYDWLRLGVQVFSNNAVSNAIGNMTINSLQEKDLPSNTQTAYHFELQYVDGELKGRCNIIQQHADAKTNKYTQDDYFEITLKKDDHYYNRLKSEIVATTWSYKDAVGRSLTPEEVKNKIKLYPDLYKQYKSGDNIGTWGGVLSGLGVGGLLSGFIMAKGWFSDDNATEEQRNSDKKTGNILMIAGGGLTFVGIPLGVAGQRKANDALKKHQSRMQNEQNTSNLNIGITSSGGVGLVLNF
jgi:tetratricopeptide (TPR) repeat protein